MKRRRWLLLVLVAASAALPSAAAAQPARLANARLEPRPVTGGLQKTVRALAAAQESPAWVAWSVPTPGVHHMCCYGSLGTSTRARAPAAASSRAKAAT